MTNNEHKLRTQLIQMMNAASALAGDVTLLIPTKDKGGVIASSVSLIKAECARSYQLLEATK